MTAREVDLLSEESSKEYLRLLIEKLDEDDDEDFFGTEGWRHRYGFED
jgi:hypothetical protein